LILSNAVCCPRGLGLQMQFDRFKRRELISLFGGVAAWPAVARAQQPKLLVIGFLQSGSSAPAAHLLAVFRRHLAEAGYVEGQNVLIDYCGAEGQNNQTLFPRARRRHQTARQRRRFRWKSEFGAAGQNSDKLKGAITQLPVSCPEGIS
jgi:hypothetical protein